LKEQAENRNGIDLRGKCSRALDGHKYEGRGCAPCILTQKKKEGRKERKKQTKKETRKERKKQRKKETIT